MLGSIGKILGQISDSVLGRGDIARILETAHKELSQTNGAINSLVKGLQIKSPGLVDKAAYIAVLNGAIKKASQSGNFNLETQVNDLFVSLSVLRSRTEARSQLQELVDSRSDVSQLLNNILGKYQLNVQNILNQIR